VTTLPALALCGSNLTGDAPFSCCLSLPNGRFVAVSPAAGRGDLAALVSGLCAEHGVQPADLRELRVDLGPGSYTGLRVAITFVRFLQRFGAIPVLACDSLLLLADAGADDAPAGARLRPLLDARRGRVHGATVELAGGSLRHLDEPAALPFERVVATIAPGDRFVTTRDVATRFGDALLARGAGVRVAPTITAARLFSPRLPLASYEPHQLEPRYLMGTYVDDAGA
jgi:tRNA threonylcarbamoyl adenosine modification protein YeaZ